MNTYIVLALLVFGLLFFLRPDIFARLIAGQMRTLYDGTFVAGRGHYILWRLLGVVLMIGAAYVYFNPISNVPKVYAPSAGSDPWFAWLIPCVAIGYGIISLFRPMWVVEFQMQTSRLLGGTMTVGSLPSAVRFVGCIFVLGGLIFFYALVR